nr:PREDICTED: probable transmembrane ascorbate ferrireductase 3 [Musa acuminata subsp. malaccensis]
MCLGFSLVTGAGIMAYNTVAKGKNVQKFAHMMLRLVAVALGWLFGFVNFWFPKASPPTRTLLVSLHASAGMAIFPLTVCRAETGLAQMDAAPGTEAHLVNFAGLFIRLFAVTVSIAVALRGVSI